MVRPHHLPPYLKQNLYQGWCQRTPPLIKKTRPAGMQSVPLALHIIPFKCAMVWPRPHHSTLKRKKTRPAGTRKLLRGLQDYYPCFANFCTCSAQLVWRRDRASHKPNSVPARTLADTGGNHLSRTPVTRRLKRPTRRLTGEQPAQHAREARRPILSAWSCSEWGLPSQPVTRLLVSSYLTISPLPATRGSGRYVSVALSLRSPSLAVSQHSALWSSDFPRTLQPAIACLPQTHCVRVTYLAHTVYHLAPLPLIPIADPILSIYVFLWLLLLLPHCGSMENALQ